MTHVGIVGLGLIGGSLARDLLARDVDVTAFDRDGEMIRAQGAAHPWLGRVRMTRTVAGVCVAPTVVVAVPVQAALDVLDALAPALGPDHLVLDVGGTKAAINAHAESLGIADRFVGCHPLAGDHRSGWGASRAGLFAGVPVYVCAPAAAARERVVAAETFWRSVGAAPVRLDAAAHDRLLGLTSHLPHMLSAALALVLRDAGLTRAELGPGGRELTRLAAGQPRLWTEIALQNGDAIAGALDACEAAVRQLRLAVAARDAGRVEAALAGAARWAAPD